MSDSTVSFEAPVLIAETHETAAFDCGEPILDDWLRRRALENLKLAASRTYVVTPTGSRSVAGYYALSMGQILATETLGSMRRNMPRHIPAVVLGRLAIGRAWQGHGLGGLLLRDVLTRTRAAAGHVSARLLVVHAMSPAAEDFYRHHGFTRLPTETPTLAIDLIKLDAIARGQAGS